MKISETITPVNAHKVFMGSKEITLTLDTETNRVTIDAPAMFKDPVVTLTDLQEALGNLRTASSIAVVESRA